MGQGLSSRPDDDYNSTTQDNVQQPVTKKKNEHDRQPQTPSTDKDDDRVPEVDTFEPSSKSNLATELAEAKKIFFDWIMAQKELSKFSSLSKQDLSSLDKDFFKAGDLSILDKIEIIVTEYENKIKNQNTSDTLYASYVINYIKNTLEDLRAHEYQYLLEQIIALGCEIEKAKIINEVLNDNNNNHNNDEPKLTKKETFAKEKNPLNKEKALQKKLRTLEKKISPLLLAKLKSPAPKENETINNNNNINTNNNNNNNNNNINIKKSGTKDTKLQQDIPKQEAQDKEAQARFADLTEREKELQKKCQNFINELKNKEEFAKHKDVLNNTIKNILDYIKNENCPVKFSSSNEKEKIEIELRALQIEENYLKKEKFFQQVYKQKKVLLSSLDKLDDLWIKCKAQEKNQFFPEKDATNKLIQKGVKLRNDCKSPEEIAFLNKVSTQITTTEKEIDFLGNETIKQKLQYNKENLFSHDIDDKVWEQRILTNPALIELHNIWKEKNEKVCKYLEEKFLLAVNTKLGHLFKKKYSSINNISTAHWQQIAQDKILKRQYDILRKQQLEHDPVLARRVQCLENRKKANKKLALHITMGSTGDSRAITKGAVDAKNKIGKDLGEDQCLYISIPGVGSGITEKSTKAPTLTNEINQINISQWVNGLFQASVSNPDTLTQNIIRNTPESLKTSLIGFLENTLGAGVTTQAKQLRTLISTLCSRVDKTLITAEEIYQLLITMDAHSRGCGAALIFAKLLMEKHPNMKIICNFSDPVWGGKELHLLQSELWQIPHNIRWIMLWYATQFTEFNSYFIVNSILKKGFTHTDLADLKACDAMNKTIITSVPIPNSDHLNIMEKQGIQNKVIEYIILNTQGKGNVTLDLEKISLSDIINSKDNNATLTSNTTFLSPIPPNSPDQEMIREIRRKIFSLGDQMALELHGLERLKMEIEREREKKDQAQKVKDEQENTLKIHGGAACGGRY